jgi:hypothetical protein
VWWLEAHDSGFLWRNCDVGSLPSGDREELMNNRKGEHHSTFI